MAFFSRLKMFAYVLKTSHFFAYMFANSIFNFSSYVYDSLCISVLQLQIL